MIRGKAQNGKGRQWNRLKPVTEDYLDSIGFPSKGDRRLLDFAIQEKYFEKIKENFHQLVSQDASDVDIANSFPSLSLEEKSDGGSDLRRRNAETDNTLGISPTIYTAQSGKLSMPIMAMRKIREGLVASARIDAFALNVYKFIIRTTIPIRNMESYHPALLHLLYKIHPIVPLEQSDHHEYLGYYILDLACRQGNLAAAYEAKYQFAFRNAKVEAVLKALIHDNWYMFWNLKSVVTKHEAALMEWAEERIRTHALKSFGKSYLTVDKQYLEKAVNCWWENLADEDTPSWSLNGDIVTIRKINKK
ncbi:hypothetical protein ACLMJK_003160 [Lecanora helva]